MHFLLSPKKLIPALLGIIPIYLTVKLINDNKSSFISSNIILRDTPEIIVDPIQLPAGGEGGVADIQVPSINTSASVSKTISSVGGSSGSSSISTESSSESSTQSGTTAPESKAKGTSESSSTGSGTKGKSRNSRGTKKPEEQLAEVIKNMNSNQIRLRNSASTFSGAYEINSKVKLVLGLIEIIKTSKEATANSNSSTSDNTSTDSQS